MRFIVDLYRYVIFGLSGLTIIGTMLLVLLAIDANAGARWNMTGPTLLAAFGIMLLLVLSLSGVAILISMHDRYIELADETADIAASLRRLANRAELEVEDAR